MGDQAAPGPTTFERHAHEGHRDVGGGAARAAIFGVSDGLVTNVSLILGMAGAHPAASVVRLAGLAGLVAGACSMALGEYVSMQAQRELFQREIDLERTAIERFPDEERLELSEIYRSRGLSAEMSQVVAAAVMGDDNTALEAHAREELGISTTSLGSPFAAAFSSFGSFALGALVPLGPWLVLRGSTAVAATLVLAGVMAILVGVALATFTGRSALRSGLRQLLLSGIAASVAYGIGTAVGAAHLA